MLHDCCFHLLWLDTVAAWPYVRMTAQDGFGNQICPMDWGVAEVDLPPSLQWLGLSVKLECDTESPHRLLLPLSLLSFDVPSVGVNGAANVKHIWMSSPRPCLQFSGLYSVRLLRGSSLQVLGTSTCGNGVYLLRRSQYSLLKLLLDVV